MLLKTKLHLPKRAIKPVRRPEIVQHFSLDRRLTAITAPAGYGKTSIVLEWLDSLSVMVGWVSLDEGDNDVNQFTQYLLAARENAAIELVELRNQVSDITSALSLEYILTALINIFVDLSKPTILVLDDYHLIHDPDIHDALTFLIENKPADLHITIMSRSELPFPIGRWRASNEVTELRTADLRLSQDEIAAFFATQKLSGLSKEDIQALEERTEGWIAALQLATIAMKGKEDTSHFISDFTGSHIYVVDYLTDEVMQQQPKPIQHFLMKTSLLPRLNANLCDNVLRIEDSQIILQNLEAQNLFLIGMDNQREWYRYHHLFQDMLRYRLQREAPEQITALHHRTSRWFIQQGWIEEGIAHALLADDWQTVTQIINQNVTAMFSKEKMNAVRRWYSHLPNDIILGSAELCINYAWALMSLYTLYWFSRTLCENDCVIQR
jgi:LuxR family maltose regulon positive regulatory protein